MIKKQELTEKELKKWARKRWNSYNKSCKDKKYDNERASLEMFEQLFIDSYNDDDFKCFYCGRPLNTKSGYPYKATPSVDHYLPLSKGGIGGGCNIVLCCYVCNIVKGTMSGHCYEEALRVLKHSKHWKALMDEWFEGRRANKIARAVK